MPFKNLFPRDKNRRVHPINTFLKRERRSRRSKFIWRARPPLPMRVVSVHTIFKRYGGQRHPQVDLFENLQESGDLVEWKYLPPKSTIIYVSHEWLGTSHPDPEGNQTYHLLLLLWQHVQTRTQIPKWCNCCW